MTLAYDCAVERIQKPPAALRMYVSRCPFEKLVVMLYMSKTAIWLGWLERKSTI
jgi:hypothetical protein